MSRRVLITGGASGLGRALVERYAAAGDRVLVADRDRPGEPLPGAVSFLRLDVRLHDDLKGVAQGCRTFVPLFKQQGGGHIVNIASSAGLLNTPGATSYNASKAAVISLSETIRQELAPFGIRATVACPGPFRTGLRAELHSPDPELAALADREIQDSLHTAEQVAGRIVHAVDKGHFLVLTRPTDRRALCLKRLFPRVADARAVKKWRRTSAELESRHPQKRRRAA